MKSDFKKTYYFKQGFFIFIFVGFLSLLIIRLFDLQIRKGEYFRSVADENRFFTFPIKAYRGVFLDRYQDPLVWNIVSYYQIGDPLALYSSKRAIAKDQALDLMATNSGTVDKQYLRYYRYPFATAHILGYVGSVTKQDVEENKEISLDSKIGKSGLEEIYESVLSGKDGQTVYEINALGKRQRLIQQTLPVSGQNITTTLDPYLSLISLDLLKDLKGTIIISDASNGEILTLVNNPSFDTNLVSNSWSDLEKEKQRREIVSSWFSDPDLPFFNRSTSGIYPPGSVFKLVTALTGLENHKIDDTTTVIDEGVLKVGEYQYGNWYFRQYGKVEGEIGLRRSIARSNDIFFYKVAEWVGPDNLALMARRFGFGEKTIFDLPTQRGLVPDPSWKEQHTGERWYLGNTYHFGIGQGDLLVTPIQVNQMGQILADMGTLCDPQIVKKDPTCHEVGLIEENINKVLAGMTDVCSTGGTAYPFFSYNEKHLNSQGNPDLTQGAAACKTGTAEFGAADEKGHRQTHAWFIAIVEPQINLEKTENIGVASQPNLQGEDFVLSSSQPTDKNQLRNLWIEKIEKKGFPKRIVITVLVESDEEKKFREGSQDAAPIAKEIVDWIAGKQ